MKIHDDGFYCKTNKQLGFKAAWKAGVFLFVLSASYCASSQTFTNDPQTQQTSPKPPCGMFSPAGTDCVKTTVPNDTHSLHWAGPGMIVALLVIVSSSIKKYMALQSRCPNCRKQTWREDSWNSRTRQRTMRCSSCGHSLTAYRKPLLM